MKQHATTTNGTKVFLYTVNDQVVIDLVQTGEVKQRITLSVQQAKKLNSVLTALVSFIQA